MRDTLREAGCFVAGFFTSVRGFVMESVRVSLLGKAAAIPDDCDDLYRNALAELKAQMRGPGQAGLLTRLLTLPVSAVAYFLLSFACPFDLVYDPRQKDEDVEVRQNIATLLGEILPRLHADIGKIFQGVTVDQRSDQELGLQLADLVAGEVRRFFVANNDILNYETTKQLITGTSHEPL